MNTIKLNIIEPPSIYEHFKPGNIGFSLLTRIGDEELTELNYPSQCRDFIGPACFAANMKITNRWTTNNSNKELLTSTDETLVSVTLDEKLAKQFVHNIKVLNEMEEHIGIPVTKAYLTNEVTKFGCTRVVFVGDAFWMQSPLAISTYTFFIRCLSRLLPDHEVNTIEEMVKYYDRSKYLSGTTDAGYLRRISANIDIRLFLSNFDKVLGDNPITGVDDQHILHESDWYAQHNYDNDELYGSYKRGEIKSGVFKGLRYFTDISAFYSYAGPVTMSDIIAIAEKRRSAMSGNYLGIMWASNYIDLAIQTGIKKKQDFYK